MKYRPTGDKVLIRMDPSEGDWDGVLVRPDIARDEPMIGTVVARGPGRWAKKGARRIPMGVDAGDRVMISWATGQQLTIGGVYHREVSDGDILGFVD